MLSKRRQASYSGQALVEFALILLILLFIIFVVIESARLFQANLTVQNAARAAGRYAITGEFDPSCLTATPKCDDPRLESIKAVAFEGLTGLPLDDAADFDEQKYYLIEVFSIDDTDDWVADYAGDPGDPVLVRVTYRVGIVTPIVNSIARSVRVRGQVVYNNEQFHQRNLASGTSPGSDEAPDLPPLPEYSPPDLLIGISASATVVTRPDPIIYTVAITNVGSGPATGVVLTDTLPSQVQYASGAPAGCTVPPIGTGPGGTITCPLGDLMPGDSTGLAYTVDTVTGGSATNTATARSAEVGPVSASTTTEILDPQGADLGVSKTAAVTNGEVALNEPFDYTVTVTNNGPAEATNVLVEDTLSQYLDFVSVTPGASVTCPANPDASGLLQCEISSLANGDSRSIVIRVSANTALSIHNTASVDGDQDDLVSENNSDTTTVRAAGQADLSLVKTVSPERVGTGEMMLYTLQVTNNGPNDATGVVVTENMPDGVGLVSMSTTQGNCAEDPQAGIVCSVGAVAVGTTVTIQIQTIASLPGWATNSATVDANEVDPDASNNTDEVSTYVEPFADLAIAKSASDLAVYRDDPLTYTLTVEHRGGADVPRVLVEDQLSRDVTLESATVIAGTDGNCSPVPSNNYVECTLDAMEPGDTSTIEIAVRPSVANVDADPYGDLTNTAVVTSTFESGVPGENYRESNPADNEAEVSTYIGPGEQEIALSLACGSAEADTTITVTGSNWTVSGGETVQLSIVASDGQTEIYRYDDVTVPLAQSWSTNVTVPNGLFEPLGAEPWGEYNIRAFRKGEELALAPFTFPCPAPDLVVDSVALVSEPAVLGESSTYRVVVRNLDTSHTVDATAFTVGLYFDPAGATATSTSIDPQYQVSSLQVGSLAVGATVTLDFVVSNDFGTPGDHNVWALADSTPAPAGTIDEIYDDNNTASTPVLVLARPVAGADSYSTDEDVELSIAAPGVLENDSDADSSFSISDYDTTSSNGGIVNLNGDGSFTYISAPDVNGEDTFTYEVCDTDGLCAVGTVSITVGSVNDAPVAVDDPYTTNEDTVLNVPADGVLGNDTDVDGDNLTVATVNGSDANVGQTITLSSGALLTLNADGSISFDPNGQFEALDDGERATESFTYTASDGTDPSNVATVTITITGVNDAPVAGDDAFSTDEDTPLTLSVAQLLANDSDVEGDPLTVAIVDNPSDGTLVNNGDGTFTYTPNTDFDGPDSFTYRANDGSADSNLATVAISVTGINDAPVAADDTASTAEDTAVSIDVAANDSDPDGAADLDLAGITVVASTANGALVNNGDGTFTYMPNANYYGNDSFTYEICDSGQDGDPATDGDDLCASATVSITVSAVNDAPLANDDAYSTDEDVALTVNAPGVVANDTDVEGDALTAIVVSSPSHGSLTLNADGSFTYTPNANYYGNDTFTYSANDGTANSAPASVTITVNAVNDAPVTNDDSLTTDEDTPATIDVAANDSDVDGDLDPTSATVVTGPSNGSLVNNGDGTFTYTPNANYNGSDSFTYEICDSGQDGDPATDGDDLCASATVSITVSVVNDAPVADDDAYSTDEDTVLDIAAPGVLDGDSDVENDPLSAVLVSGSSNGGLTLNPDGSFVYTPTLNFNGTDSFSYRANDGTADSNLATVTITVNPVNDAPVAADDSGTTAEESSLTIDVTANDSDPDGQSDLTLAGITVVASTVNGALVYNGDGTFTYTPSSNYNGSDSFTYEICDVAGLCDTATVTITVTAVNDAPVANGDAYGTDEDTPLTVGAPGVLANDTDVEGDGLTAVVASGPSNGSLTLNADGSFTYTPNANFNGSDSFTYTASDGQSTSNTATVSITVNAVNDAPVANNDSYSVNEDGTLTVDALAGVLNNDTDVEGDGLTATQVGAVSNGTLTFNADGSFTYTPNANFQGSDTFTYRANDGSVDSNLATVSITVDPVNDAPVAADDTASVLEDDEVIIPVLDNDTDVDGDTLTVASVAQPATGTVSINVDDTVTFTATGFDYLAEGETETATFNYTVSDGQGGTNTATITVTITGVNDAPQALTDSYSATEDETLTIDAASGVLSNDGDVDGGVLTVSASDSTSSNGGTVSVAADGSFTYTPALNFTGTDSFSYTVSDGQGGTDTATVTIAVGGVNDPPVAVDDSATTDEDVAVDIDVLANDTDPDGDALTVTGVGPASNGTVTPTVDGSAVTYTPGTNFNGSDSFSYTACDPDGLCSTATVTVTVNQVNDAPTAEDDSANATEDGGGVVINVLANDSDVEGDPLTVTAVSTPANGTAIMNLDDTVTYTPDPDHCGADTFTYTVSDGTDSSTATVTVNTTCVNDAPVASEDTYSTDEDVELIVSAAAGVLANDTDVDTGDTLTVTLVSTTSNGILTLNEDGSFTYTPNANFTGGDSFTYTASDGQSTSDTATVTITVNPVNDAPAAVDDNSTMAEDGMPITIDVLANDDDVESDPLTVTAVFSAIGGTAEINPDSTVTFTVSPDFCGTASFDYSVSDGTDSSTATVTIAVTCVNDAPVASDDAYSTDEDVELNVSAAAGVLANDTDVDMGDTLNVTLVSTTNSGTLTLNADGSFTYSPNTNFTGSDSFTYTASDGQSTSNTATVTITVNPVNDAPVAADDGYITNEDTELTVAAPGVLDNDTDIDGDPLNAVLQTTASNGSLTLNADGSFVYTPTLNFTGEDTFTYVANDGNSNSNVATVTITVNAVNDAPVANNDSYSISEDGTLTVDALTGVLANDTDVEGDVLTAVLVSSTSDGTLSVNGDGSFTYTPNANFHGSDTFTYRANDGSTDSNLATVTITVDPVNDAPVATDDTASVLEDDEVIIPVLDNDTDVDGDTLTVASVTQPTTGTVSINADDTVTFAATGFNYLATGETATVSFTYSADDGIAGSNAATVTVTVTGVNDAPQALTDSYTATEDETLTVAAADGVLSNDGDVDGSTLTVSAFDSTSSSGGSVSVAADGSFVYTPTLNFAGTDSFSYTVSDGQGGTDTTTVTLTVTGVNDPPVAEDDGPYTVAKNGQLGVDPPGVLANDTDVDTGDVLTAILVSGPSNGNLTFNADGSFTYTPTKSYSGPDSFTYRTTDGAADSGTATVTFTVQ